MKNAMNFRPVGLMLLFCLIPLWAFAQSVMVKGVVKDTSGEAIIGASAFFQDTGSDDGFTIERQWAPA